MKGITRKNHITLSASMSHVDLLQYVGHGKRRKITSGRVDVGQYHPGAIIRIKLKDFMSYSLSEFHMAPNLNMIIGPNGTGKSTIVCAICIGLAGKTDYLGKPSMQFAHFVKQGQLSATIEIELKGNADDERLVIRREINAENSKSKWYRNNRESNEKQIRELVKSLEIQLDNLCQFLPQDRVSKFADQKPNQLLKEIERSFAGGELLDQHEEIIKLSEDLLKTDKEKEDLEGRLLTLTKEKESLQLEVEKFNRYRERKQDLQMHKKLIPFVKIQDAKVHFSAAKSERDQKIATFKAFEEQMKPISSLIAKFADGSNSLVEEIKELEHKERSLTKSLETNTQLCKNIDDEILDLEERLKRKLTEIIKKSHKLEVMQQELNEWEKRKDDYTDDANSVDCIKLLSKKRDDSRSILNEKRLESSSSKERVRLLKERELKYDNIVSELTRQLNTDDKLNVLSGQDEYSQFTKTYKVVQFLRRNSERFSGRLFEPALVSLTVKKGYGNVLANIVSLDSQLAVVTTSEENHKFVTRQVLDGLKLNVSFRQISSQFSVKNSERNSLEELKRWGFDGYLSDFISGPAPVVQMLCEQHAIHLIPVSIRPLTEQQLERIQNSANIQTFVSGDQILRTFTSSYGNRRKYSTANFLNTSYKLFDSKGLSEDAKANLKSKIEDLKNRQQAVVDEIEAEKLQLSSKQDRLIAAEEDYKNHEAVAREKIEKRNRYLKLVSKVEQLQKDIEFCKTEIDKLNTVNQSDIKQETNEKIKTKVLLKFKVINIVIDLTKEIDSLRKQILLKKFHKLQQDNRKVSIQSIIKDVEVKREKLQQECEQLKRYVKELKQETSRKIKDLNEAVNRELNDEERNILSVLAKSYMDAGEFQESTIILKIDHIRKELNSFSDAEESSIVKFSKVESSIADIELRLPDLQQTSSMFHKQIAEVKSRWLPKLESLIFKISKNFNENFTKVYPLGEVRLYQDPESYSEWRLEILVQFRSEEELTVLDGTAQSGGEKVVSTAIFLNSLQGLTNSPFRVVDEINQGMDARNERLVHKLIVESACTGENTSQYFLITPKLLTNLVYHEKMSVHCIMAGKFCPDPLIDESFLRFGLATNYIQ